jgi:hypothetical protein
LIGKKEKKVNSIDKNTYPKYKFRKCSFLGILKNFLNNDESEKQDKIKNKQMGIKDKLFEKNKTIKKMRDNVL